MDVVSLLPIVVLAALFWLLLIRPQRRRQAEALAMQRGVQPGDEVMIAAGIFGTVSSVEEDRLQLEVSPGVTMTVARAAVVRVVPAETPDSHDLAQGTVVEPDQDPRNEGQ